jgi:DNA-binding NarL/FixJ family response regulator
MKKHSDFVEDKINILIIEDNRFIRSGWEILFKDIPDFCVVGSFPSCEEAFKSESLGLTDLALMDIGLPGISGIEGIKYLKEHFSDIIIVMCTVHEDDDKIFEAICAGAVGYLLKKTSPSEMVKAIRDAYKGGSPMTPSVARKVIASFQKIPEKSKLQPEIVFTEREEQILSLMAHGKSYSSIANEVFLSIDGVYYHIRNIYEKLQVHSRAEAIAKGLKKRLIQPPR